MRSPARLVTGTAAAALTAATLGLSTAAPSAYAGDVGQLVISPAVAAPGTMVTVRTTACGNDAKAAGHANSLEAGNFTLASTNREEMVVATFTVPKKTHAGSYRIDVTCENGRMATGTLRVKAANSAKYIAAGSPAGTVEDNGSGNNTGSGNSVPSLDNLAARGESLLGNQNPFGTGNSTGNGSGRDNGNGTERNTGRDTGNGQGRDNGNGTTGNGQGGDTGNGQSGDTGNGYDGSTVPLSPTGHVKTGVGGSVRPDTSQIAAGAGVLAASAVGGAWLLRRRASGTQADS
ncbi:hypothetical protein AB0N06_13235 [Streptomyces sp. NPDC051020]|uniref:hypothetical protein n=1 Tax=Streptomyces sp. NPDC051020 TaxID=3155409 RepID=UPI003416908F